jgi:hypothetical protein
MESSIRFLEKTMEEFVPTVPYVSARVQYAKKCIKEAEVLLKELRDGVKDEDGNTVKPGVITRSEYGTVAVAFQVLNELAYGLDAAMKALNIYADTAFWTTVPEHTYAASDLGTKARVALATVDPV